MKVLVTGGTGHLGSAVVLRLKDAGHQVRILARQPRRDSSVEWVRGDLATGDGVREAAAGVNVIIHAATNSPSAQRGRFMLRDFLRSPADVDVHGTRALLDAAQSAHVEHFIHVSIVGLEQLRRVPYSRRKLEAEQLVRDSSVPWTILRATSFYWLLERMCANMLKQPILALPARASMAPVDSDEFADYIVERLVGWPGERDDFVGPQALTMVALMEQYLAARGVERRIHRAPLPKKIQSAITAGVHLGERATRNDDVGAMAAAILDRNRFRAQIDRLRLDDEPSRLARDRPAPRRSCGVALDLELVDRQVKEADREQLPRIVDPARVAHACRNARRYLNEATRLNSLPPGRLTGARPRATRR
jgi:uncharacterized protein YbjT (DUF2867 family)